MGRIRENFITANHMVSSFLKKTALAAQASKIIAIFAI